jgi:hypothetical protein
MAAIDWRIGSNSRSTTFHSSSQSTWNSPEVLPSTYRLVPWSGALSMAATLERCASLRFGERTMIRSAFVLSTLITGSLAIALAANAGGASEVTAPAGTDPTEKIDGQDWPPVAKGIWQLTSTTAVGEGKPKTSTQKTQACTDPSWMFATYWGTGVLERAGCQFSSWKTSGNQFRLESVCKVRKVGTARMKGTVVLGSPDKFRLEGEVSEGKKRIRITQIGQLVSSCSP